MWLVGPAIVLVLGTYGAVAGGLQVLNGLLVLIGAVLLGVGIVDFPWMVTFDPVGVHRRCLMRTNQLVWEDIRLLGRPAKRQSSAVRLVAGVVASDPVAPTSTGGLVIEIGKRPHMLMDRTEAPAEYDAIRSIVEKWGAGVVLRAGRPADGAAPSWMYKRRGETVIGMVDRG